MHGSDSYELRFMVTPGKWEREMIREGAQEALRSVTMFYFLSWVVDSWVFILLFSIHFVHLNIA